MRSAVCVSGQDTLGGASFILLLGLEERVSNGSEGPTGRFCVPYIVQANGTMGVMDYAVSGSYPDNGRPVEGSRFVGETLHANLGVHLTDA